MNYLDPLVHWLAFGLGSGLSPIAPGTLATLLAIPIIWLMTSLKPRGYFAVVIGLFIAGIYICGQTAQHVNAVDPGHIVYDEIVGFLLAMCVIPFRWRWIVLGFIVYRFFDILKPFPIGWLEEQLGLGTGIMVDDMIAGLYTLLLVHVVKRLIEIKTPTKNGG